LFSTIVISWFLLVGLSLLYVLNDALRRLPVSWVQKLAWILVVAYTGPLGLVMYVLCCRSPGPGRHDAYTRATWKQSVNSEMHCLAGDATGILLAAVIVSVFALPNGIDLVIEYVTAYGVGLFVFQALMMAGMYQGNYLLAVRKTIFAETVSMNMVMIGMIPAMVLLNHYLLPGVEGPLTAKFWFVMSMATIVGGVTAYPINYFLVSKGLKHGCMTVHPEDLHKGHRSGEASGMQGHSHAGGHAEREHSHQPLAHEGHPPAAPPAGSHEGHAMSQLPLSVASFYVVATFAAMLAAGWITSFFVPIQFIR
jgi:hypothetical protein